MAQISGSDRPRAFFPSLEGVRGYAFLAVFIAHCCDLELGALHRWWLYPVFLLKGMEWVTVPVFFVLSGFLICGILIDTRERQGYFRVFYSRRVLRVFPLYYLTLLAVVLFSFLNSYSLSRQFWIHFLYVQNLFPSYTSSEWIPEGQVLHLWSMAVEEQFYLLWPLVVWICPNRRVLLRVTLALIGFSFALRFAAPWLKLTPWFVYFWTPTRVDAIMLGAALAIVRGDTIYLRLVRMAKYVALAGVGAIVLITVVTGDSMATTWLRAAFLIPLWNLTAAGIVAAVMQEGSILCRICSGNGICWLGARSYALYLFHFTYFGWFFGAFVPYLAGFMPHSCALLATAAIVFGLTVLLAVLSYRIIEQPAMNLKKRLKYGAAKMPAPVRLETESVLPTSK